MNTKTTVWLVFFIIGFVSLSHGQYYDAMHRQTADQIKLFKSHNLKVQILYIQQAGNSVPYGINYYDTGGRVVLIANPNHHEHFSYDNKGRMDYWLDSANDGRRFEKFEYHFGYDEKGVLNQYKTSKTESKFTTAGQNVNEDVMCNGTTIERHIYSYNTDGKLTQELIREMDKDSAGKVIYSRKVFYNKYGDLASEITFNPIKNCKGDSTIIINTYDNKGKVIHQQKSIKTLSCGAIPTAIERKAISQLISYTYNPSTGLLVSESMASSNPSLNYRKEYEYNENGIILKEQGYDGKGKLTTSISYNYICYPQKR